MKRLTLSVGLVGVLLLSGCASEPDLLQCQTVAALDTELEAFFDADNAGTVDSPEQTERLRKLADEYAQVEVDGELEEATKAVSADLLDLYAYRIDVQNGDEADPAREKELRRTAIDTFVDMQAICIRAQGY